MHPGSQQAATGCGTGGGDKCKGSATEKQKNLKRGAEAAGKVLQEATGATDEHMND